MRQTSIVVRRRGGQDDSEGLPFNNRTHECVTICLVRYTTFSTSQDGAKTAGRLGSTLLVLLQLVL